MRPSPAPRPDGYAPTATGRSDRPSAPILATVPAVGTYVWPGRVATIVATIRMSAAATATGMSQRTLLLGGGAAEACARRSDATLAPSIGSGRRTSSTASTSNSVQEPGTP